MQFEQRNHRHLCPDCGLRWLAPHAARREKKSRLQLKGGKDRRPLIRLQGKWLQDLGFQSGDKIAVEENNSSLLINAVPDGNSDSFGVKT